MSAETRRASSAPLPASRARSSHGCRPPRTCRHSGLLDGVIQKSAGQPGAVASFGTSAAVIICDRAKLDVAFAPMAPRQPASRSRPGRTWPSRRSRSSYSAVSTAASLRHRRGRELRRLPAASRGHVSRLWLRRALEAGGRALNADDAFYKALPLVCRTGLQAAGVSPRQCHV